MYSSSSSSKEKDPVEIIKLYALVTCITGWMKIIYIPALLLLARYGYEIFLYFPYIYSKIHFFLNAPVR
jgi:hypothetical protein